MSDDFIPLNQSTPIGGRWQGRTNQRGHHNSWHQNGQRRGGFKRWGNNSQRNSSYGSDNNSSYGGQDKTSNIDDYLHPSMLQDPWAQLRRKFNESK